MKRDVYAEIESPQGMMVYEGQLSCVWVTDEDDDEGEGMTRYFGRWEWEPSPSDLIACMSYDTGETIYVRWSELSEKTRESIISGIPEIPDEDWAELDDRGMEWHVDSEACHRRAMVQEIRRWK